MTRVQYQRLTSQIRRFLVGVLQIFLVMMGLYLRKGVDDQMDLVNGCGFVAEVCLRCTRSLGIGS